MFSERFGINAEEKVDYLNMKYDTELFVKWELFSKVRLIV